MFQTVLDYDPNCIRLCSQLYQHRFPTVLDYVPKCIRLCSQLNQLRYPTALVQVPYCIRLGTLLYLIRFPVYEIGFPTVLYQVLYCTRCCSCPNDILDRYFWYVKYIWYRCRCSTTYMKYNSVAEMVTKVFIQNCVSPLLVYLFLSVVLEYLELLALRHQVGLSELHLIDTSLIYQWMKV